MPINDNIEKKPLWYKDAIIYQVHVKSFFDSDNDGVGDFRGLIEKLDYLEDLGITAIWLLPFYPSPLKDDGYDISSYIGVNPTYGTLADFKKFLREAHNRGIRVITELVLNHTSDQHPWFQLARSSPPGSEYRDYYVWSDDPDKYQEARIIFQDFETSNWTWDPVAKSYFWHRFYSHQPDLNFNNPRVRKELLNVIDFWFSMGVDGMRLDAVPYLFEREGTNCENLPETHEFLKQLRSHVDSKFEDRMLLAEANQWPEDAAVYFGDGDECHMAFHFPLMPKLFMAVQMENPFPIIDIMNQTPEIPYVAQWAIFLRNHDELTLEMVTDQERDFMYRTYAKDRRMKINLGIRRRLAPLMDNDKRKMELMKVLLFTLPGTPIIYYGDEIGMGDNYHLGDRDGIRTPMQWSSDRNAGFSRVNPQRIYLPVIIDPEFHYQSVNVEVQNHNSCSFLWWMKALIAIRSRFKSFGRGNIEFVRKDNPKVLAFLRSYEDEKILVLANLSRYAQPVTLDLQEMDGYCPIDLFSWNRFPRIRSKTPYLMTLGGFEHLIFALVREEEEFQMTEKGDIPEIWVKDRWTDIFDDNSRTLKRRVLPQYLQKCRWYGGKSKLLHKVKIIDRIIMSQDEKRWDMLLMEVIYSDAKYDRYLMPVTLTSRDSTIARDHPQSLLALVINNVESYLCDSIYDPDFRSMLLRMIYHGRTLRSGEGKISSQKSDNFKERFSNVDLTDIDSEVMRGEQTNTSIRYGDSFVLKFYRRLEEETNPEIEILRFLTERTEYQNVPGYAGCVSFKRSRYDSPTIMALLMEYIRNEGDAYDMTRFAIRRFFEEVLSREKEAEVPTIEADILDLDPGDIDDKLRGTIGEFFLENIELLAKRTAQLHISLASDTSDPAFRPEPFTTLYQRSIYQEARNLTKLVFNDLRRQLSSYEETLRKEVESLLQRRSEVDSILRGVLVEKIKGKKIRVHGDFHLGQILFTGKDFFIFDFEGEPARSISERKLKFSPVKDLTGLVRSFDYAVNAVLNDNTFRDKDLPFLKPWARIWYKVVASIVVRSYMKTMKGSGLLPEDIGSFKILFNTLLMEKAVYELGYELNNRPEYVSIPLNGIKSILEGQ